MKDPTEIESIDLVLKPTDVAEKSGDSITLVSTSATASPVIPMPASIVSSHAATMAFKSQPLDPPKSQANIHAWKKPKALLGAAVTIFAIILTLFLIMMSSWGDFIVLLVLICHGLLIGIIWSYCVFTLSGAFVYSSPQARRYSRAWIGLKGFFISPVALSLLLVLGPMPFT